MSCYIRVPLHPILYVTLTLNKGFLYVKKSLTTDNDPSEGQVVTWCTEDEKISGPPPEDKRTGLTPCLFNGNNRKR